MTSARPGACFRTSLRSSATTGFHASGVLAKNVSKSFGRFGISSPAAEFVEDFLCPVHPHLALPYKDLGDPVNLVARRPDRGGDVPRVEAHMPPLNSLRRERAERGEVLREADGRGNPCELLRRLPPERLPVRLGGRMDGGRAADESHRHRELDRPDKVSGRVLFPLRKRVVAGPGGPRRGGM